MSATRYLWAKELKTTSSVELDFPEPMEFRELSALIGLNGSGKSYLMFMWWLLNNTQYMWEVTEKFMKVPKSTVKNVIEDELKFMLGEPFDDYTKWEGSVGLIIDGVSKLTITFNKKDISVDCEVIDENLYKLQEPIPAIFNSTDMRTMTDIKRYFGARKMLEPDPTAPITKSQMVKLGEMFKIQDIYFGEIFLVNLDSITLTEKDGGSFNPVKLISDACSFGESGLVEVKGSLKDEDIILKFSDGSEQFLSKTSKGTQAMVIMTIYSRIV